MTERPILFSGPMVRAILDGRKSQTRRILKPQPESQGIKSFGEAWAWKWPGCGFSGVTADQIRAFGVASKMAPYAVGDRLWIRETWSFPEINEIGGPVHVYRADGERDDVKRWRPSIHMPKWAARIWLTVTEVRVQRLQEISRGDCMGEGCPFANMADGPDPREWFRELWNSTHGPGAFERNDWVAAISFEKAS